MIEDFRKCITTPEIIDAAKTTPRGFSLATKITLCDVLLFYMLRCENTINQDIALYFSKIEKPKVSKQGMFKALDKLNPKVFPMIIRNLAKSFYERGHYNTLNGYVILAVDGTKIDLPYSFELAEKFGGALNQTVTDFSKVKRPQANCSILYDVLNHVVLNATMEPYNTSELPMLFTHLEQCEDLLKGKKVILLCDRYYVSAELFLYCMLHGYYYLVRNKSYVYKDYIATVDRDGWIDIPFNKPWLKRMKRDDCREYARSIGSMHLRVVKNTFTYTRSDDKRANKEVTKIDSVYLTNLKSEMLSSTQIVDMYHDKRWDNETAYFDVKVHCEAERFNSAKYNIVVNSYFAKVLCFIISGQFFEDADTIIVMNRETQGQLTAYDYIPNMKNIIDTLHFEHKFTKILHCDEIRVTVPDAEEYVQNLIEEFSKKVVPVRPGRHYKRWGRWMASLPIRKYRLDGRRDPPIDRCHNANGYVTRQ